MGSMGEGGEAMCELVGQGLSRREAKLGEAWRGAEVSTRSEAEWGRVGRLLQCPLTCSRAEARSWRMHVWGLWRQQQSTNATRVMRDQQASTLASAANVHDCNAGCKLLSRTTGLTVRHNSCGKADGLGLLGVHCAASDCGWVCVRRQRGCMSAAWVRWRTYEIHGCAHANQSRKSHSATIDQWDTPSPGDCARNGVASQVTECAHRHRHTLTPAKHSHDSILFNNSQIRPHCKLQTTSNCMARYRGNDWLGEYLKSVHV